MSTYLSEAELEGALDQVLASPRDGGHVEAIVARPATDARAVTRSARLSPEGGLEGDRWAAIGGPVDHQVSIMNARLLRLLAGGDEERMALAGDNLVVDLDLGDDNLPAGQRLRVGEVVVEVTDAPHTGCGKFAARFGPDAARYINAAGRRGLHLRGRYVRVLRGGTVRVGDVVVKMTDQDRSFVELNRASTERIRTLAARLSDDELRQPVGEHWTVAITLAHLAFWDRRALYILDETERDGKLCVPEIDIFVNDLSLPLWAAIPPREAARIAIETAEALDARLENYPQALIEQVYAYSKRWVVRALHRGEHLDEVDAALNG